MDSDIHYGHFFALLTAVLRDTCSLFKGVSVFIFCFFPVAFALAFPFASRLLFCDDDERDAGILE